MMGTVIAVVFENERFVAADKAPGWLSVPSRMGARDARPCLGRALEERLGARLWPVHRLDEEASGLILFARDAAAHAEANGWFERRLVRKTYEALTEWRSAPSGPAEEEWHSRLLRGKRRAHESPAGKPTLTRARRLRDVELGDLGRAVAWSLEPITGRPHQLRYELAARAAPILGDELYGARTRLPGGAIALRCVRLEILEAARPEDFDLPRRLEVAPLAAWLEGILAARPPSEGEPT